MATIIASATFKKLAIKRQTEQGLIAPAGPAGSARYMRRVTSTMDLTKATYQSAEVNESQQVRDMRHGTKAVSGTISGELPVGGYQVPLEGLLRQIAIPGVTSGPLVTVAAASTTGRAGTFTRSAGSWLTDGFKIGDVVRPSGFLTTATDNNRNYLITGLTATVMTVFAVNKTGKVTAKAAGDSVTFAVPGRKIYTPQTGHLRDYVTIEHWFSDIAQDEVYRDCVFTAANISLPPSGLATIELPVMGIGLVTGQAAYFTNPAASTTGKSTAAVNGVLVVDGVAVGLLTGLTLNISGNHAYADPNGVVGEDEHVDIAPGIFTVGGQATVLFTNAVLRDKFINEEESSLVCVLTADGTPNADFMAFSMSRLKFSGAAKNDVATGMTLTMPFTALENVNGGAALANLATTLTIQDSQFTANP